MTIKAWAEELLKIYGSRLDDKVVASSAAHLYDIKHLLMLQIRLTLIVHSEAFSTSLEELE